MWRVYSVHIPLKRLLIEPLINTNTHTKNKCCIVVHHDSPQSGSSFLSLLTNLCSTVASKNKLRQNDSVNTKGMQWQFCFVSDESTFIYISANVKKEKEKRDLFELSYNIQYQYVLRLQKLCYYSECVSDHSYSNVLYTYDIIILIWLLCQRG